MPVHPAIVHIPLVLALLAPAVLLYIAVRAFRGGASRRAWAVIVALQAAVVGGGLVALQTGEADEDRVEATVGEAVIEVHEHRAQTFVTAAAVLLALTVVGIVVPKLSRAVAPAALVAALVVAGLGVSTGHAGGTIVYGAGGVMAAPSGLPAAAAAQDDDD